jgi:hypothetical protein
MSRSRCKRHPWGESLTESAKSSGYGVMWEKYLISHLKISRSSGKFKVLV